MTGILFAVVASLPLAAAEGEAAAPKALPPPAIPAPENINTYLHLKVNNLTRAEAPVVRDRKVLLTFFSDQPPRYVAAAFAHEKYLVKHVFFRNQHNVYFLVYDLEAESPATLDYRLIVDGLWQSDPENRNRVRNDQGVVLSRVSVAPADLPRRATPEQGFGGEVEFRYVGKPGQQVALAGNFNNWDPFTNYLEEEEPGQYALRLALPAGTLFYQFVVGTRTFLDPANARTGHDANGAVFSIFENVVKTRPVLLETSSGGSHG